MTNRPTLVFTGLALNHPDLLFDPNYPYTCCLLCGVVYQTTQDREPQQTVHALLNRRRWSFEHATKHEEREHEALAASGLWCTPEAAIKLAGYGLVNAIDLVMSDEIESAYKEAHVIPVQDCQGEV